MRIDVHAHLWVESYMDVAEREGPDYLKPNVKFLRQLGGSESEKDMGARFEHMDETGIDLQIISPSGLPLYSEDETKAVRLARYSNDFFADYVERFPDRFRSYAVLPLPNVEASIAEVERAFDTLGMRGVIMLTSILDRSPADPLFDPVWAELDRRKAVVFFHPAGVGAGSRKMMDEGLAWNIGAPIEDTMVATQLVYAGIPQRFPNVKIIIAHAGGAMPMLLARLNDSPDPAVAFDTPEPPSELAKRLFYDTITHGHPPALRCAVESFGESQIVFGTDYPANTGERARRAVDYVTESLPDEAARRILDSNAAQLFDLG
jgi:predicted TIM-barrel fold metal-dependent hydrolase